MRSELVCAAITDKKGDAPRFEESAPTMSAWIRLRALRVGRRSPGLIRAFSSSLSRDNSVTSSFTPARRLSGRRCMITGGTSGIGFAIAARFLQESAATVTLVGRSQKRLMEAAEHLRSSNGTVPQTSEDNGEVATRAPEEDNHEDSGGGSSGTLQVSDRIRLLVGDISETESWMRELESEMVGPILCRTIYLDDMLTYETLTGQHRHPRQRSRDLHLQHPPQNRTLRYIQNPAHKPRRRDPHLARIPSRLHPQPSAQQP